MSPLLLFAIILLAPVLAALIFKCNAGILFMSLCVGSVLVRYVPSSSANVLSQKAQQLSGESWQLILLLAPPVIAAGLTFRSVKGGIKQLANLLAALGTGLTLLLLVQPLLPGAGSQSLASLSQWQQLNGRHAIVVTLSAAVSLFFIWFQRRKSGKPTKAKD